MSVPSKELSQKEKWATVQEVVRQGKALLKNLQKPDSGYLKSVDKTKDVFEATKAIVQVIAVCGYQIDALGGWCGGAARDVRTVKDNALNWLKENGEEAVIDPQPQSPGQPELVSDMHLLLSILSQFSSGFQRRRTLSTRTVDVRILRLTCSRWRVCYR